MVGTVFSLLVVAVANTTAGAVAQPAIADDFGAGAADVGWVVFGYSAAFATMTAIYGGLVRRFGAGPCLTFGALLIVLGAIVALAAANLPMLIAGRLIQGMGAGAIPTSSVALIANLMSGPRRAWALGVNVAAVGVGYAAGPLVGGIALETVGWRGAMAIGLLALPAVPVILRMAPGGGTVGARLDPRGMLLLAGTVGSLIFLVNRVPVLGLSPPALAALLALLVCATLLVLSSRSRPHAALPIDLLTDARLLRVMLLGFVGQTAFLGTLVVAPIAAARVHGVDGLLLGLLLVPMATVIAVLSPRNGLLEARIGRPATSRLALLVITGGALSLSVAGAAVPPLVMLLLLVAAGVGFSFLNAPLSNEVTRLFPGSARSLALGIYNLAFFLGAATGGAITTALVQANVELPFFSGRPLAGFSTGLLLVGLPPLLLASWTWVRGWRAGG